MSSQLPLFPPEALLLVLPDLAACSWVRFVSIEPKENRFRFYTITWQQTLWDEWTICTTWGRIGGMGRSQVAYFESEGELKGALVKMVARRLDRGYWPKPSLMSTSPRATTPALPMPVMPLPRIPEREVIPSSSTSPHRHEPPRIALAPAAPMSIPLTPR